MQSFEQYKSFAITIFNSYIVLDFWIFNFAYIALETLYVVYYASLCVPCLPKLPPTLDLMIA